MPYERLLVEAAQQGVYTYEKPLHPRTKGLYADNIVWINRNLSTSVEKHCILAEELGHYHTSSGNILDQADIRNRKQERTARAWAYEKLVPLASIVQAHRQAIRNRHELADHLSVTEDFLDEAIKHYIEKYGIYIKYENLHICFEPLGVLEMLE
ncbi:hypothetical protein D3C78_1360750 [compost metagenome]